jgi:hypothetical protein
MVGKERDWRGYWNEVEPLAGPHLNDALKQVGKTQMGLPIGTDQLDLILDAIVSALALEETDHVVDLGCGNGLVSERIGAQVEGVLGLDASLRLVEDAQCFRSTESLQFALGDLTATRLLPQWPGSRGVGETWKWYAYEVIQHLAPAEFRVFLANVAAKVYSKEDGPRGSLKLFLGSIPDRTRIRNFYDTPERWDLYERNSAAGTEQIGTWWTPEELHVLSAEAGFQCKILTQEPGLYTSHYRFHALLSIAGPEESNHDD